MIKQLRPLTYQATFMLCSAKTKSGRPCRYKAREGSDFCGVHGRATVEPKFEYDVFLSYSHKDKEFVHSLADRLKRDGVRVWLDDWVLQPGDAIGRVSLAHMAKSRTLGMCMSPDYFESEWGSWNTIPCCSAIQPMKKVDSSNCLSRNTGCSTPWRDSRRRCTPINLSLIHI